MHNSLVANNEENNVSDTQRSDIIINPEKKMLSYSDGLDGELLIELLAIVKDLRVENQRLRMKANIFLKIKSCHLR